MKVTGYYPIFYTNDIVREANRLKEDFGFDVEHHPEIESLDYYVLSNDYGTRIDLVQSHFPDDNFSEGIIGMHVNVSDFNEGAAYFEEQGYSLVGTVKDEEHFMTALFKRNDNDYVVIFQHKK